MEVDWGVVAVLGSAAAAFLSFLAFAVPLLRVTEKKERYRSIIEQRRKDLYRASMEEIERRERGEASKKDVSAAQSMAALYRLQRLAGKTSTQARNLMLQAGIRNPGAPLIFLFSRIVVPMILAVVAMVLLGGMNVDLSRQITLLIIGGAAAFGFVLPRILVKNIIDKRQVEISLNFPDALDMMLICVQGGLSIEGAITKIAGTVAEHSETLAEEMGLLSAELGMLNDRRGAYQGFATRVGSGSARSFATAMMQAEQYGTSVSKALRVLADEQRDQRMAEAERKAASLPPKLTVPMILFFLPALFITILGPAFLSSPK